MADISARHSQVAVRPLEYHSPEAEPVVKAFEIQSHPQLIFLSASGKFIAQEKGYRSLDQVEQLLQRYYPDS